MNNIFITSEDLEKGLDGWKALNKPLHCRVKHEKLLVEKWLADNMVGYEQHFISGFDENSYSAAFHLDFSPCSSNRLSPYALLSLILNTWTHWIPDNHSVQSVANYTELEQLFIGKHKRLLSSETNNIDVRAVSFGEWYFPKNYL